jgi:hypothetical protein
MNELDAIELIETLVAAFPRQKIEPRNIAVYARMIEDFDRIEAEAAIIHVIATQTFFPAVAELRTAIGEGRTMLPAWEEAWEKICAVRKEYGVYVGPRWGRPFGFDDLTSQALQLVGGYESVCQVQFDDEPTMRAQFRDAYNNLRKRQVQRHTADGLANIGTAGLIQLGEGVS